MDAMVRQAEAAVADRRFEGRRGYCQRFVRQVVQAVWGSRYDAMMKGTARASGRAARRLGWAVAGPPQPGDLLYRLNLPFGHVGIYLGGDRIVENSTRRRGRVRGAVGFCTRAEFGRVDVVVRLAGR